MARAQLFPTDVDEVFVEVGGRRVRLTNLRKPFWTRPRRTKGDLLAYYARVAAVLVPHLADRAMVMKRYPQGAAGDFFFMKRAPSPRPEWIETVSIDHGSKGVIDFPIVQDLPSLLWVVNLGCIDLNQWYARRDEVNRPDYLHFDLDPGSAPFARVREAALALRALLEELGLPSWVKTSGSKGLHVYVPIVRGPSQRDVWELARAIANELAQRRPRLVTVVYRVADRPAGRVLVDFNQNQWGRTLASVYSVRPTPRATVSAPLEWDELPTVATADFTIDNMPARVEERGDLWAPLLPGSDAAVDLGRLSPSPSAASPPTRGRRGRRA